MILIFLLGFSFMLVFMCLKLIPFGIDIDSKPCFFVKSLTAFDMAYKALYLLNSSLLFNVLWMVRTFILLETIKLTIPGA